MYSIIWPKHLAAPQTERHVVRHAVRHEPHRAVRRQFGVIYQDATGHQIWAQAPAHALHALPVTIDDESELASICGRSVRRVAAGTDKPLDMLGFGRGIARGGRR